MDPPHEQDIHAQARPAHRAEVDELTTAAARLNVALILTSVRASADFAVALASGVRERAAGLVVLDDALIFNERKTIADFTFANRLPAICPNRGFARSGGLMSYGPSLADLFRRAAGMVDQILKGAKPGELPVEQPTRFEFVINQKTARALGAAAVAAPARRRRPPLTTGPGIPERALSGIAASQARRSGPCEWLRKAQVERC